MKTIECSRETRNGFFFYSEPNVKSHASINDIASRNFIAFLLGFYVTLFCFVRFLLMKGKIVPFRFNFAFSKNVWNLSSSTVLWF